MADDDRAALIAAVRAGDVPIVTAILDRDPALIRATDDLDHRERPVDTRAMRLLHLCVAENQLAVARVLIARGADLDARNHDGRAALHDAFELNRPELADLLMRSGATIDACAAAAFGKHDLLTGILRADATQANDRTTHSTPLGWAAYANDTRAGQILIDHGAIVDRPPYDGDVWGPTAHVCNIPFAQLLLASGADPNWRDAELDTLFHHALHSQLVVDPAPFIRVILAAGGDPTRANDRGVTPLDDAERRASAGDAATTYFPKVPLGTKRLAETIALLREVSGSRRRSDRT